MRLLFLSLINISSLEERGIYTDLLREFWNNGNELYIVCPSERRERQRTQLQAKARLFLLKVWTLNLQKTFSLEKGIGFFLLQKQFLIAIKKYFPNATFDLILYSTPPITFSKIITYFKMRDGAYTYLLLKDIFPQNAVDLELIKKGGFLHRYFKKMEKNLYNISDTIGCMSIANKSYLLNHNPYLSSKKVEINPNSIRAIYIEYSNNFKEKIRQKYKIPLNATVFLYGGNLGRPQGIEFLLETIEQTFDIKGIFFLIIGSGTEYGRVEKWFKKNKPENALLLPSMPQNEYEILASVCDVGLIFLNKKFTIPNFPSRLLSYLVNSMPVLAATDPNTDVGKVIEAHGVGFWVRSGDINAMKKALIRLKKDSLDFERMRHNAYKLLKKEYCVDRSYKLIIEKVKN